MGVEYEGPIPSGKKLWGLLIDLLADQEGVKITYELEEGDTKE